MTYFHTTQIRSIATCSLALIFWLEFQLIRPIGFGDPLRACMQPIDGQSVDHLFGIFYGECFFLAFEHMQSAS